MASDDEELKPGAKEGSLLFHTFMHLMVSQVSSRLPSFLLNVLVARRLTHEQFGLQAISPPQPSSSLVGKVFAVAVFEETSAILELGSEPLYILAQHLLPLRLRMIVVAFTRCAVTYIFLLQGIGVDFHRVHLSMQRGLPFIISGTKQCLH